MSSNPVEDERPVSGAIGRIEATVRGRVQGVGFRYFVVRRATELGLVGWVANRPDGSVHCVAEGDREALERLIALMRQGPTGSIVEAVDAVPLAATGRFERFSVRSGAHSGD